MSSNLINKKSVYFIGIGGIGVSAVARMFIAKGIKVTGSDASKSKITEQILKNGGEVYIGHQGKNLPDDCDLVVYSIAVKDDNPELILAKSRGIHAMSYPEILGSLSRDKYTIAVSGTHGKTTTTGMIAKIMIDAGLSPTVILGSLIKNLEGELSNFIYGDSKYLLLEACEYRRSFINLEPNILVITNIDSDHLDYYKDIEDIKNAFGELADKMGDDDYIVINKNQDNLQKVLEKSVSKIVDSSRENLGNCILNIPGEHNRENALAALSVATLIKIEKNSALKSLENFQGTWRRFEYLGQDKKGAQIYIDYAHHPKEIIATLNGARELFKNNKIKVVFQPHLYSRTKQFLNEFAQAFNLADEILLAPIYPGRETLDPSISSNILADLIRQFGKKTLVFDDVAGIQGCIEDSSEKGDVVIIMGAGDIYTLGEVLIGA